MSNKQTMAFQTEVKQLLNLMIHSLYSNKEIFLRELISNASDAIDKLRFEQIKFPELGQNTEFLININIDKENKTIILSDNGIGMSYDEVIDNLGTIAKSGTKSFLEKLTGDEKKDSNLIGQFGVGFYSSFIVAKEVTVDTLKAGFNSDQAVKWISSGDGEFTVEQSDKTISGTTVTISLKDDSEEFLSDWTIRNLIRKYSDHINYPIQMIKAPTYDDKGKEIISLEQETVNKANALWTRNRNEINDDEYVEFYKHVSHDFNPPMKWTHSKVEGTQEYTMLLYIPAQAPYDLYDHNRRYGIKLYIKRVFIMDDAEKLLPNYLRFIRGIIDSQNLPLNVSREILQSSKDIDAIRTGATKKILSLIEDIMKNDPEKFAKFITEFGQVLKEGMVEDFSNKDRIAKILRFASTHNDDNLKTVSLDDYISRMKDGQEKIYYITAESYLAAKNSPHLEIFKQKGIEVLLLSERIDEWMVGYLTEYEKKSLVSVAKGDLDLGSLAEDDVKKDQAESADNSPMLEKIKIALGDKIKEVKVTNRLTESPSCLVVDTNALSLQMEKLMRQAGQSTPEQKPTLEINPHHKIIQKLNLCVDQSTINDLSMVILEQAQLAEGISLDDPVGFVKRMNSFIS